MCCLKEFMVFFYIGIFLFFGFLYIIFILLLFILYIRGWLKYLILGSCYGIWSLYMIEELIIIVWMYMRGEKWLNGLVISWYIISVMGIFDFGIVLWNWIENECVRLEINFWNLVYCNKCFGVFLLVIIFVL